MRALGRIRVGWSGSGSELKRLRHFASVKRSSSSPQHFDRPSGYVLQKSLELREDEFDRARVGAVRWQINEPRPLRP